MKRRKLIKSLAVSPLLFSLPGISKGSECKKTTSDIEGPFYSPNAPIKHILSPDNAEGVPLFITGTVYSNDCISPVGNSTLDIWHADSEGVYDNIGYNFRGKFPTDEMGNYAFQTVLPGKYLNGSNYRPRHIHFKIQGSNSDILTTQLYFVGDSSIPIDPWASDPLAEGRIIPLNEDNEGNLHGVFDISLNIDISTEIIEKKLSNISTSRIINISPQPVTNKSYLQYYLTTDSYITINIYDLTGRKRRSMNLGYKKQGLHKDLINGYFISDIKASPGIYVLQLLTDHKVYDAKRVVFN